MKRTSKACAAISIIMCAALAGLGQTRGGTPSGAVELNGTIVTSYVPPGMGIALTPYKIETSNEMSMLYYRFSVTGTETTYDLHWYVYVTDSTGKITGQDSWWDRGEWASSTEVEGETVFEFKSTPGTKLTIILQEMISSAGVRSISLRDAERQLFEAASDSNKRLPPARLVKHTVFSEDDQKDLITQSLNTIVEDARLRRALGLKEGSVLLLADGANNYSGLFNVESVSQEQINTHLKRGEPVDYLECCRTTIVGRTVSVSINHNTPSVHGNTYIPKGIRVTFVYRRVRGQFTLQETKTEHF